MNNKILRHKSRKNCEEKGESLRNLRNLGNFLGSTTASIGNLIAEGERERILKIFWELTAINFYVASVCAIALYHLIPPFITLWLGAEYVMSDRILILIIVSFCLSLLRSPVSQFKYGYGLFSDVWSPIAESIILITVAVCGGYFWGLEGVLLGSIASTVLVIFGWQAYFLFSSGLKTSVWLYIYNYGKNILVMILSFYLTNSILTYFSATEYTNSWLQWIIYAVEIVIVQGFLSIIIMMLFIPGMRFFVERVLYRLKK